MVGGSLVEGDTKSDGILQTPPCFPMCTAEPSVAFSHILPTDSPGRLEEKGVRSALLNFPEGSPEHPAPFGDNRKYRAVCVCECVSVCVRYRETEAETEGPGGQ